MQIERSADKVKLAKLADTDLLLDDEQSDELSDVISRIEEAGADELEKVFKEADSLSVGDSVRAAWELDKSNAKEKFFKDQKNNSKCNSISVIWHSYVSGAVNSVRLLTELVICALILFIFRNWKS